VSGASDAPELTPAWRTWGRLVAAIAAVSFALTAFLTLLDSLSLTAPAPSFPAGAELPDRILIILQNQADRFPVIFVSSLLAIVAYSALAALGPVLRRALGGVGVPRGTVLVAGFAIAGAIGVIGELLYIGGLAIASDPTYCECAFRDAQLIARGGVLDVVTSMQSWMTWGLVSFFGIGLFAAASLCAATHLAPRGWSLLSRALAALLVLVAVLGAGFPPLAHSMGWDVDPNLVVGAPSLVILLILLPWWALWLRAWLGHAAPPEAEPAAS